MEWRNLQHQWHRPHCVGRSRGSEYQWSSNAFILIPTCSSARDDMLAGSSQSWGTETNDTDTTPSHLSFRPQRSVVEKSPDSVGQAPMRWEISRLRVSMIYKYFIPISTRSPARDDMLAGSSQSWGTETNDTDTTPSHLSFRPERSKAEWSGEISGPNGTGPIAVGNLGAQSLNGVQIP